MTNYAQHVSAARVPQTEQARADQVPNNGGGFTFQLDKWKQLDRFLILGAEGGTYYATERTLTRDNAKNVVACLDENGPATVARIVEISEAGRAPKNDPALFALALATTNDKARAAAYAAIPRVARTGTHLLHLVAMLNELRGWGPGLRKAVGAWYLDKEPAALAYQMAKYQQRDGWSQRDVLRLLHPDAGNKAAHNALFRWATHGLPGFDEPTKRGNAAIALALPPLVVAMERTRGLAPGKDADRLLVELIHEYGLTHEMIPNEHKNSAAVWEALLEKMPLGAMVRNLAKMTRVGLISPLSAASAKVTAALGDEAAIRTSRLHPLALLSALRVYAQGHGERSSATWEPDGAITDALDAAFYSAFGNVTPMNKGTLLALDVSGSMTGWGYGLSPEDRKHTIPGLTPRDICAAMAMVTARVEAQAFGMAFSAGIVPFELSKRKRLDDVIDAMGRMSFSHTDCALPMLWATQHKKHGIDTFVIYTDNETNGGSVHPYVALQQYRRQSGRADAKLIVVGITPTPFTIADPSDPGMLDVVGFDTSAPEIMSSFVRDELLNLGTRAVRWSLEPYTGL